MPKNLGIIGYVVASQKVFDCSWLHLLSISRGNDEQITSIIISLHSGFFEAAFHNLMYLTAYFSSNTWYGSFFSWEKLWLSLRKPPECNKSFTGAQSITFQQITIWSWWLKSDNINCKEIQILNFSVGFITGLLLVCLQSKSDLDFHVDCSFIPVDPLNEIKRDDRANTSCPQWDHSRFLEHYLKVRLWWPE